MFLSPLLMDVDARTRSGARRVIGLDHGGAALQHAVRTSLPYDADEIAREDFVLECHDRHERNAAAIRHQLAQAGIGYDAKRWLDPMSSDGSEIVRRLFYRLQDAGRIGPGDYAGYRCPQCATVLSDSELVEVDGEERCERCQAPVERQLSHQMFLDLSVEARELSQMIERDTVSFSDESSKKAVLQQLRELKPICISRQSWWGHKLPGNADEVLSPWFTLAAWSLQAAGWPADSAPVPIDTVFVDASFLARWVVPSQLIALVVHGRPAFRHIEVTGAVYVVERENEDEHPEEKFDEERYAYRTVLRKMLPRLGNTVEPATLVQRFGADALRLWYLLSLSANDLAAVVLTEARAREARHVIARLNASLSSLLALPATESGPFDDEVVRSIQQYADAARAAYPRRRFDVAAKRFVDAVNRIAEYSRAVEKAPRVGSRETAAQVVRILHDAFSPLCPFILGRFAEAVLQQGEA